VSRRSDDADLTHWCRRSAYLDQVRSLRTNEAAAGLFDLGEETDRHRNSGQAPQSVKRYQIPIRKRFTRSSLYKTTNSAEEGMA
jgi:hypothetical protein